MMSADDEEAPPKELAEKLRRLDVFLETEFGSDFYEVCMSLGVFVARLVCRHDWTFEMLEKLFAEQIRCVREYEKKVQEESGQVTGAAVSAKDRGN
jgi:hypothetical protein